MIPDTFVSATTIGISETCSSHRCEHRRLQVHTIPDSICLASSVNHWPLTSTFSEPSWDKMMDFCSRARCWLRWRGWALRQRGGWCAANRGSCPRDILFSPDMRQRCEHQQVWQIATCQLTPLKPVTWCPWWVGLWWIRDQTVAEPERVEDVARVFSLKNCFFFVCFFCFRQTETWFKRATWNKQPLQWISTCSWFLVTILMRRLLDGDADYYFPATTVEALSKWGMNNIKKKETQHGT